MKSDTGTDAKQEMILEGYFPKHSSGMDFNADGPRQTASLR